jgi:hypothetical protein
MPILGGARANRIDHNPQKRSTGLLLGDKPRGQRTSHGLDEGAAGIYSAAGGVWVPPRSLEGQPPCVGGDQLMDRFRPPRARGVKSNWRRRFEERDRDFPQTAPAMQDLLAGQIDLCFATTGELPLLRDGSINAYAVTSDTRLAIAPTFRLLPSWDCRRFPSPAGQGFSRQRARQGTSSGN